MKLIPSIALAAALVMSTTAPSQAWFWGKKEAAPVVTPVASEQDFSSIIEMTIGAEDAPLDMIEYASFTCPHCASFHENVYPELKKDYIDTGKLKFTLREAYFDKYGLLASLVARCAQDVDKFHGVAGFLFKTQGTWLASRDDATIREEIRKVGRLAGLDDAALDACTQDEERITLLADWYRTNFERDGITGTPSFMINGKLYSNMSYADMKEVLDGLL